MYTEFHTSASDLDEKFLKSVKALFKSKAISIIVTEEPDETEYLLQSDTNKKMLLKSIKQVEKGELVKVNIGKTMMNGKK